MRLIFGRRIGLWFTSLHAMSILLFVVFPEAHQAIPFLSPIDQPLSERITSLIVLLTILILLIVYYQTSHERSALLLNESNQKLSASNKAAEEMNKLKSNFLANMSHEIRTPLNGILGLNELMRDHVDSEEMEEFLDIQSQSGQRLLNTINGILSLAKLEVDSEYFNLKRVNLFALAKEVIDNQRVLADKGQLNLSFTSNKVEAVVYADETMIYQVISNLVGNAIKFTNPGGSIDVSINKDSASKTITLNVKDTGIGIAPDFLQKVFEPFEQESTGQNRKYQGSGLGLSISKRFVELMGGKISVSSNRGVGSTFSISLPAAEVQSPHK
ncbi:MAG: HAMP domain-containing sensor histidine kinase [Flavobacteriales bacterium]